jgi:NADPH-dependent 7-cyano-7-deazaguanine reductase QueF
MIKLNSPNIRGITDWLMIMIITNDNALTKLKKMTTRLVKFRKFEVSKEKVMNEMNSIQRKLTQQISI